ncbi:ras association domain-containing protein 8 isoform X2 [Aethina tumida]|uniref:ras association domain-containing protein 8 isoform X2 n=1 Tax=Aethina tumida TaxID=116153 RepID=UPI002149647D|nr:ras association domain-containing protein 8 isoform X2 [Aethina tumida]
MELKVWVEGIQRIVCGVSESTTCQDVVFALAHATGKSGRFTLIERWRNNERQLAPNENPMKILMKWGEYSSDVQFILQYSDSNKNMVTQKPKSNSSTPTHSVTSHSAGTDSPERMRELQKTQMYSMTHLGHLASPDNIGVVKGVQQVRPSPLEVRECRNSPHSSPKKGDHPDTGPPSRIAPPYKDPPQPPPYRDPPPPTASNHHEKYKRNILQENIKPLVNHAKSMSQDSVDYRGKTQENVLYNAQYRELIALINYQREKLSNQQADLTKYDAEIVFWEGKEREKQMQLDYLAQEILSVSNESKTNQDQALNYIEEESEIVKQQEKTLKSEITLLRSKLANCETELLQCKNKIRLVMDELQMEQRAQCRRSESRKQLERSLLAEVERLQKDIELAKQSTELHHLTAETLKKEVAALETAIIEKKKQVEHLVSEMKEANLESLSIAPPEDVRQILEGPTKAGTTRKMIGSPRQLENAVPTNKNPHGVWV